MSSVIERPVNVDRQLQRPEEIQTNQLYVREHGETRTRMVVMREPYERPAPYQGLFVDVYVVSLTEGERMRTLALADLGVTPYPNGAQSSSRLVKRNLRIRA